MTYTGTLYQYPESNIQDPLPTIQPPSWIEPTVLVPPSTRRISAKNRRLGLVLLALALGGMLGPALSVMRLEGAFWTRTLVIGATVKINPPSPLPPAAPVVFNPLVRADGSQIVPVNTNFSLIIPKIGINAPVIPNVNPVKPGEYSQALLKGVAHASTSYFPNENGTVYLFSHSTNYEWFVDNLNAVFYLLKNLNKGDLIVVFYKGERYTYKLRESRVVGSREISYLVPQAGKKNLILQTCWPPGSTAKRLLLFADLIEENVTTL